MGEKATPLSRKRKPEHGVTPANAVFLEALSNPFLKPSKAQLLEFGRCADGLLLKVLATVSFINMDQTMPVVEAERKLQVALKTRKRCSPSCDDASQCHNWIFVVSQHKARHSLPFSHTDGGTPAGPLSPGRNQVRFLGRGNRHPHGSPYNTAFPALRF